MKKEEKDWLFLKRISNHVGTQLGNSEVVTVIERHENRQTLTISIPKKGKVVIHNKTKA